MAIEYTYFQRLIDLRKSKGKTIADMAYESGLSASTISNYERGVRIPDGKALIKLAKYFNCSSDYLLGLNEYKNIEAKERQDKQIEKLAWYINGLESGEREKIYSIIRSIVATYETLEVVTGLHAEFECCLNSVTKILENLSFHFLALSHRNTDQSSVVFALLSAERDVTKSIGDFFSSAEYVIKTEWTNYQKEGEPNAEKDKH